MDMNFILCIFYLIAREATKVKWTWRGCNPQTPPNSVRHQQCTTTRSIAMPDPTR